MEEELKKITSKILADAKAKGDEIIAQGEEEAGGIEEEVRGRAKATEGRILREAERKGEQERKRLIASSIIKTRRGKLDAREGMINEVFRRAEAALEGMVKSPGYGDILEGLVIEACMEIVRGDMEILVRAEDEDMVRKRLGKISKAIKEGAGVNAKLSISPERIREPGAVVRSVDGTVEVSNTLAARLERMRPSLRLEVAKILFG